MLFLFIKWKKFWINAGSLLREDLEKETVMKTEKETNPQPGKVLGGKESLVCWDREGEENSE